VTHDGRRRPVLALSAGVLVLAGAVSVYVVLGAINPSGPDPAAVHKIVLRGETLMVDGGSRDTYYPPAWHGGTADGLGPQARAHLKSDLDSVFAPPLAAKLAAELEEVFLRAEGGDPNSPEPDRAQPKTLSFPIVRLSGRVDSMDMNSLVIKGATATVSARVGVSGRIAQVRAGHEYIAQPHNVIRVHEVLQRVEGTWLIVERAWTFAPGGGP
jgi:hypothetical protein